MVMAVVSKWGNSSAVRIPKQFLNDLGITDNDKVKVAKKGRVITIEKPIEPKTLRQLVEEYAGMDFDTYVQNHDYEVDYTETGIRGHEKI